MMTRKDFIELAKTTAHIIKETNKADKRIKDVVVTEMSNFCLTQNFKFDKDKFAIAINKELEKWIKTRNLN